MNVHQIVDLSFDVNLYFVDTPKPVLVDAGVGGDGRRIATQVREMLSGRKLQGIILTHRHFDHVGGAAELMAKFSADVYASSGEAPALIRGDEVTTGAVSFGGRLVPIPVKILDYDSTFDIGDGGLLVIHTPGHTEGSICLYHAKSKSLFTGDLVFTDGNVGRWDLSTGDFGQIVRSLEKLVGLEVQNLYPGHGPYAERDGLDHVRLGLQVVRSLQR